MLLNSSSAFEYMVSIDLKIHYISFSDIGYIGDFGSEIFQSTLKSILLTFPSLEIVGLFPSFI